MNGAESIARTLVMNDTRFTDPGPYLVERAI